MKEIFCLKRKWILTLLPISILIILICKALPFVAEYIFARGIYRVLAIVLGTEGDGLAPKTIAGCDYTVKIPMAEGVDSLNVAAASAVAFWELRKR